MGSHVKPSTAVVSLVVSFVSSLLSLLALVGSRYALKSSSHLLISLPCSRYPVCVVDVAGFQLEMSFVQRPSWCLAIIRACFQYVLLYLRIHDVIPLASNRSPALHGSHHVVVPRFQFVFWLIVWNFVEGGSWMLSSCSLGSLWVGFSRVVLRLAVGWGSPSPVSSTLVACAAAGHLLLFCSSA